MVVDKKHNFRFKNLIYVTKFTFSTLLLNISRVLDLCCQIMSRTLAFLAFSGQWHDVWVVSTHHRSFQLDVSVFLIADVFERVFLLALKFLPH